jgi:hypothetical protein
LIREHELSTVVDALAGCKDSGIRRRFVKPSEVLEG